MTVFVTPIMYIPPPQGVVALFVYVFAIVTPLPKLQFQKKKKEILSKSYNNEKYPNPVIVKRHFENEMPSINRLLSELPANVRFLVTSHNTVPFPDRVLFPLPENKTDTL